MNEITMFRNPEFGEIRTVEMNGETWFVGADIATVLGYSNPQKAIRDHVDDEDKMVNDSFTLGRGSSPVLVNESGVYALIFSSKLENAKRFKHWVTSEVLPAIRKHGAYVQTQSDQTALDIQLLNARTMNANVYVNLLQHVDTKSESYKAILMACAANTAAGQLVLPLPKAEFGKTYSATDISRILGISRNKVGRIANEHGLKSDGFGEWYHDVAANGKECDNFRHNDAAIEKFREILGA